MTQEEFLASLEEEVRGLLDTIRTHLAHCTPEALGQVPAPGQLSLAQGLSLVNLLADHYLPRIDLALHKAKARRWGPAEVIERGRAARRALYRADPPEGKRFRAPKAWRHQLSREHDHVVKTLLINGEILLRQLKEARKVDLNHASVRRDRSWFGRYSLATVFEWLITHMRRQVKRAVQASR